MYDARRLQLVVSPGVPVAGDPPDLPSVKVLKGQITWGQAEAVIAEIDENLGGLQSSLRINSYSHSSAQNLWVQPEQNSPDAINPKQAQTEAARCVPDSLLTSIRSVLPVWSAFSQSMAFDVWKSRFRGRKRLALSQTSKSPSRVPLPDDLLADLRQYLSQKIAFQRLC